MPPWHLSRLLADRKGIQWVLNFLLLFGGFSLGGHCISMNRLTYSSLLQARQSHFFWSFLLSHVFCVSDCAGGFIVRPLQLAHDLLEMQNLKLQKALQTRKDHSRYLAGYVPILRPQWGQPWFFIPSQAAVFKLPGSCRIHLQITIFLPEQRNPCCQLSWDWLAVRKT